MEDPILIVGAGQAGLQTAESLRAGGWEGPLLMIGEEAHGPYHRPPLSKAWLAGQSSAAQLAMRAPEALARKNIVLRNGVGVESVDLAAQRATCTDGSSFGWSGLAFATGATARMPGIPGVYADGVIALRTRDDADALAAALARCAEHQRPLVVIGGGFIGLEVAATARARGIEVTVLEAAPRLMARAVAPALSSWYAGLHAGKGVTLKFEAQAVAIVDEGDGWHRVQAADGSSYRAGAVLVGIGAVPNDAVARAAGLACDRGIIVDECSRTSHPRVVAAGDCTARRLADGTLQRLESVQNAVEQGKSAAAALLGQPRPFTAAPWFWSDQYDRKLQMVGSWVGADHSVVRGDPDGPGFSIFHYAGSRLVGVDSVNAARDHMAARKMLDTGVFPTPAQAADLGFDLAMKGAG